MRGTRKGMMKCSQSGLLWSFFLFSFFFLSTNLFSLVFIHHRATLEEAKVEQKLRKKEGGVTPEDLLKSDHVGRRSPSPTPEEDPYKMKTGGLVEMKKCHFHLSL